MEALLPWEKASRNLLLDLQKTPLSELFGEKVDSPPSITTSKKLSFPLFLKRLESHHYKSYTEFIAEVQAYFNCISNSPDFNYHEQQTAIFYKKKFDERISRVYSSISIRYWVQNIIRLKMQMNTLFHQIPKDFDPYFSYIQFPIVDKSFKINSQQIDYLKTRLPKEKDPVHLFYITRILETQTEFVDTYQNSIQLDFKTIPPLALATLYYYMRQVDGLPIDISPSDLSTSNQDERSS